MGLPPASVARACGNEASEKHIPQTCLIAHLRQDKGSHPGEQGKSGNARSGEHPDILILCGSPVLHKGLFRMTLAILYQALQEQLTSVVQEIGHLIDPIATAARGEAAQLGHKVRQRM